MSKSKAVFFFQSLTLIIVAACAPATSPETVSAPTDTLAPQALSPTESSQPTPSPTPIPAVIRVENAHMLTVYSSFGVGESLRKLAFSPDGRFLASAGGNTEDFDLRIWDVQSGELLHTLAGHTGIVWDVEFSPVGHYLASASSDRQALAWDWAQEAVTQKFDFPSEVGSVSFSPNGQVLAAGGVDTWPDAAIWLYDTTSWQYQDKLSAFWNIPDIEFSPDAQWIVGGGTSRNVHIWNSVSREEEHVLNHAGQVANLAIAPDGKTIASALCQESTDDLQCTLGAVWLWDLQSGQLVDQLSHFSNWGSELAYSPAGDLLFASSRDGLLNIYDTTDNALIHTTSSPGGSGVFALSPDGNLLAIVGFDGEIHLWKIASE